MMSVFLEQKHVSCLYLVSIILESAPVSAPPPAVSAPVSARLHCRLDPEQRVLGEASMRTHVEVMVESL